VSRSQTRSLRKLDSLRVCLIITPLIMLVFRHRSQGDIEDTAPVHFATTILPRNMPI